MITIRKGNHTLQVSKNTYEIMFKSVGYEIVKEEAKKASSKYKEINSISKENKEMDNIKPNTQKDLKNENKDKEDTCNKEKKESDLNDILEMISSKENKETSK